MIYSPKIDGRIWNDGPEFVNFMGREGAPTVAGKHLCNGGGMGGGSSGGGGAYYVGNPPSTPDYTNYIAAMSEVGNWLVGTGKNLFTEAQQRGTSLYDLAQQISAQSGDMATWATGGAKRAMENWETQYGPVYAARAQRALEMSRDLPATQEQWGGAYGAHAAQAFDASREAAQRKLQGYGLAQPSIGTAAIDQAAMAQRNLATTAQANVGRMAAMQYADTFGGQVLAEGNIYPQVAGQAANLGLGYGNQQFNVPASAISTAAGAYQPGIAAIGQGYPWLAQWGQTMKDNYAQMLQGYSAQNTANAQSAQAGAQSGGSGWGTLGGSLLGAGATLGAAYISGPMAATSMGTALSAGRGMQWEQGGSVGQPTQAFVAAGNVVPPNASPSRGREVDDVEVPILHGGAPAGKAAINVGEFIWPTDVVAWRGEQWMQKEIMKARKERQQQTVAAPEAFSTQAPMRAAA